MSLTHEEFIELYADDPDWVERRESPYFEIDLRRALKGDAAGFRELAVYGVEDQTSPRIMKALWKAGAPVRPHRNTIKRRWRAQSTFFIAAFGENLDAFLRVVDDPANGPVLIHCFAGLHRTGVYCAVYRMEFDRWSNSRAIAEVQACGYANLYEELDILEYLENYQPAWNVAEAAVGAAVPE